MMHHAHIVAISGDVTPDKLAAALDDAMERYDENRTVDWHRDTSVYAEHRDVTLAKARASAERRKDTDSLALTDDELIYEWDGTDRWSDDGWPMTNGNPDGNWDYWRLGGRWQGGWVLKDGHEDGPLVTERDGWDSPPAPGHDRPVTDNARKSSIEGESIASPYSWIDLDGEWHTKWVGPTADEATDRVKIDYFNTAHWSVPQDEHDAKFFGWLASLPADTWLIHVDYHS